MSTAPKTRRMPSGPPSGWELLASRHVLQSMDGKARWVDNVIVKRWFLSLKRSA